jgi:hypothetical protein
MDEEIEKKFAELEAKNIELQNKIKKVEDGVIHYINQHGDWHEELNDMIYPSYYKTHPEYREAMTQYYSVVEKKSREPDDPKG